jgi:hypothetical protein
MAKDKKSNADKKFIPEIIEAVNSENQPCWYFALIEADKHQAYETARDEGRVEIKQTCKGALYVCDGTDKLGAIVDNGIGEPDEKLLEEFIKEHGVPVHHEELDDTDSRKNNTEDKAYTGQNLQAGKGFQL